MGVGSCVRLVGTAQHLGVLRAAGMVSRAKDGTHARYSISDPSVFDLCDQVCGGVRRQLLELEAILQPII